MIIAVISVLGFFVIRCFFGLSINTALHNIVIESSDNWDWYKYWSPADAVFNPVHFLKWTPNQWYKYQKKLYP